MSLGGWRVVVEERGGGPRRSCRVPAGMQLVTAGITIRAAGEGRIHLLALWREAGIIWRQ